MQKATMQEVAKCIQDAQLLASQSCTFTHNGMCHSFLRLMFFTLKIRWISNNYACYIMHVYIMQGANGRKNGSTAHFKYAYFLLKDKLQTINHPACCK
jgi:hypothetical protein